MMDKRIISALPEFIAVLICGMFLFGVGRATAQETEPVGESRPLPVAELQEKLNGVGSGEIALVLATMNGSELPTVIGGSGTTFVPASVVKLLTAAAALDLLGPQYNFRTEFYADGEIEGTTLKGNLYIKGYGDPYLVSEEWEAIAADFPLEVVEGDIVADDSFFNIQTGLASPGEVIRPYVARNGAFATNFNSYAFRIEDGQIIGEPQTPATSFIDVRFTEKSGKVAITRKFENGRLVVEVKGPRNPPRKWYRINLGNSVAAAGLYAGSLFNEFMKSKKKKVTGSVRRGNVPASASLIFTRYNTRDLSQVIRDLMTYSNNFVANQILILIGAEKGKSADVTGGVVVVKDWLTQNGIDSRVVYREASGLDLGNRLPPEAMIKLLRRAVMNQADFPQLLKKRNEDRVAYKTGTMKTVHNIAGYILDTDGLARYCYALYCKGRCRGIDRVREEVFSLLIRHLDGPPVVEE
jgi:serine-type D-Ala-D-Ala carboxypeptidase/endopeptidase (penicillin-binding protein 4)